jgi:hypothetical protein
MPLFTLGANCRWKRKWYLFQVCVRVLVRELFSKIPLTSNSVTDFLMLFFLFYQIFKNQVMRGKKKIHFAIIFLRVTAADTGC